MKAVILTGGLGTRLRPFTCSIPKPLLPVVNRPFLHYQFDMLRKHGVRDVTLATAYRPDVFRSVIGSGKATGMRVRYAHERTPLGTGGAIRNALPDPTGTTLVLNGDVLQSFDITAFVRSHRRLRAEVSISLIHVANPTQFGLVETGAGGRIRRFLEKPSWDEITCDTVNAGAYLMEPSAVAIIPRDVTYSVERALFPHLLEAGKRLYGFPVEGYWMDIGTIDKYLQAHLDVLEGRTPFHAGRSRAGFIAAGASVHPAAAHAGTGAVAIGRGSKIAARARFLGSVTIGADCSIGEGAILQDCVVMAGTAIGPGARLERCVVGRRCVVGASAVIGPGRTLGDGSRAAPHSNL
jgi:NDP-sugar pyrophosphorylase family protein